MAAEAGGSNWPIVLIEVVLIFGGTLAFGWWQLRSVKRDQEQTRRERAEREAQQAAAPPAAQDAAPAAPAPPAGPPSPPDLR
jgi:cytochrome oxidase assembly protein ShyY1